MVVDDYTVCPSCDMPGLRSAFIAFVEAEACCPMCSASLAAAQLTLMDPEQAKQHMAKLTGEQDDEEDV